MKKVEIVSPSEIHQLARDKGWWDERKVPSAIPELICLMHSELSEALEGFRTQIPSGEKGCLGEELADCIIRIFDMAVACNIDIVREVEKKHLFNQTRPYRHGNKRC